MGRDISLTAEFAAQVWHRAHLDNAHFFDFARGRLAHLCFEAFTKIAAPLLPDFLRQHDENLLWRHRVLSEWLLGQEADYVVEIASGYSPRGLTLTRKLPSITYYDTDLPEVVAKKRLRIPVAVIPPNYHIRPLDILRQCISDVFPGQKPSRRDRVAVLSEGLILYLSPAERQAAWRNIYDFLGSCGRGAYSFEVYPENGFAEAGRIGHAYGRALTFLAGRNVLNNLFPDIQAALAALHAVGFTDVRVVASKRPREGAPAHCVVVEAIY